MTAQFLLGCVALVTIGGMLARPFGTRDWHWTTLGGALVPLLGLAHPASLREVIPEWIDVAAFLTGMMLLAETARRCAFFDWFADYATRRANGSAFALLAIVYGIGVGVTAVLSNDATAIVLTPAVAAVARKAKLDPWPHVLACALIANAASCLLPIANPANLVFFGTTPPRILPWLSAFLAPSLAAIVVTFALLAVRERRALRARFTLPADDAPVVFTPAMRDVAIGVACTAVALLVAMQVRFSLGIATLVCGASLTLVCAARGVCAPHVILRHVSYGVLALTGGLFALVAACNDQGVTGGAVAAIRAIERLGPPTANLVLGGAITLLCALANNLPVGLLAHQAFASPELARAAAGTRDSALVAVNLGPNLAASGSLATILWIAALRREGVEVSAWRFLRAGLIIAPPALVAAILCVPR